MCIYYAQVHKGLELGHLWVLSMGVLKPSPGRYPETIVKTENYFSLVQSLSLSYLIQFPFFKLSTPPSVSFILSW